MVGVIIATLYSYEPVIASVTKYGASEIYLLIDLKPDPVQAKSIEKIQSALGNYVKIHMIKTDIYNIYNVTKSCVEIIDKIHSKNQNILLNISAARKTKALGLLYAGYVRSDKINKIIYLTKECSETVILPKIQFKLNKNQIKVLRYFSDATIESKPHLIVGLPKSTFYKIFQELKGQGLIHDNQITDAGRIALL